MNGNWILDSNSVVIRFERLSEDIDIFSRMVNLHITKYPTR